MRAPLSTDYLVIGSGIAGLSFALQAAKHGDVVITTKREMTTTATNWAQGGIAAVLGDDDSVELHAEDTLRVGDGLSREHVVRTIVTEGPAHVRALAELGVQFATQGGQFSLTREGGHSKRRVAHYKDATGAEIQRALTAAVNGHPRIRVLEHRCAIDLLSSDKYGLGPGCFGAYILDDSTGEVETIIARATVLATGGAGKVYVYTSNPDVATGDGIAMGYRIGAKVTNLEFVQFHPTVLYHPYAKSFLVTEAARGEGGVLRTADGRRFMADYHPDGELGPRDIVARAIDNELKKSGDESVFLDLTHLDDQFVRSRFPTIAARCAELGFDIAKQPIPVVPAAHYMCGGLETDLAGRTSIPNLYAIGECAHTGLHGACRLASNSLLEGLVVAAHAADAVRESSPAIPSAVTGWSLGEATDSNDAIVVSLNWDEIRRFMWSYVGIVRSDKRLTRARRRIQLIREEIREYYCDFRVTTDIVELRNLALVAHLIIESAAARSESRGLHYTLDYPEKAPTPTDTVLCRADGRVAGK